MSLQRRRELARLSKPDLIDLILSIEAVDRALNSRQESPDTEIATVSGVE